MTDSVESTINSALSAHRELEQAGERLPTNFGDIVSKLASAATSLFTPLADPPRPITMAPLPAPQPAPVAVSCEVPAELRARWQALKAFVARERGRAKRAGDEFGQAFFQPLSANAVQAEAAAAAATAVSETWRRVIEEFEVRYPDVLLSD